MIESGVDYTFTINEVIDLGNDDYKLLTCDTMHLTKGKTVTIDSIEYTITDFVLNEYITVNGSTIVTATTFETYPFYFFNGNLSDTNVERAGTNQYHENQVPFLWNRAPFDYEKFDVTEGTNIEKTANLVWYLLDASLPFAAGDGTGVAWYDNEFNTYVIEPMQNFLENRIEKYISDNENIFGEYVSMRVRPLPHIGKENEDGTYQALFDEHLTGIEVRLDLEFVYQGCEC